MMYDTISMIIYLIMLLCFLGFFILFVWNLVDILKKMSLLATPKLSGFCLCCFYQPSELFFIFLIGRKQKVQK